MFIFDIGGALGITLCKDDVALELKVSSAKFGNLLMEAMFLESPPLGFRTPIPMDKVSFGESSRIGSPCQDNESTTLYFNGL